ANIQAVLGEAQAGEEPPTVKVDKGSNSLIVRGSQKQLASIEELAGKLDAATLGTSRQMRMIPVDRSRADAMLMAQTLKKLLEQQGGVKVEVISADQLLKEGPKEPAKEAPKGHSDAGESRHRAGGVFAAIQAMVALSAMPVDAPQPS